MKILQQKPRLTVFRVGVFLLLSISVEFSITLFVNRSVGVDELWEIEYANRNLEGKTLKVRGDILYEPLSGFHFCDVYLVDTETLLENRTHSYAIWFGVGLADISCFVDNGKNIITCQPFDPTAATEFEFKGTIHVAQIGKKEIMWLSGIDFESSRQFVDGKWQPIPLGRFVIPLENN